MTTGSWNRDNFAYLSGTSGPWVGVKWSRSWSGIDRGQKVPYNRATDVVIERVGFGAKHAQEIWHAIAEAQRESEILSDKLSKDGRKEAYLNRKAQAESLKIARLKAAYERNLARLAGKEGRSQQHAAEKAWRKLHHIPFPKGLLRAPPPKDFIPRVHSVLPKPAKVNPRPPKRALRGDEHPYNMTETRLEDIAVTYRVSTHPFSPTPFKTVALMNSFAQASWAPQTLLTANDQIALVNKLREKLRGSDFNMSVFLAEGHRTLRLIGDTAIRFAKFYFHVKHGDFAGASRSLFEGTSRAPLKARPEYGWGSITNDAGVLGSRILEFQYGVKPLLQDVYSGAQFIAHQLNSPAIKRYRVRVRREVTTKGGGSWSIEDQFAPYSHLGYYTNASTKSHGRSLIALVSEGSLPTLPEALGLLDPEIVAWELVPFSFIADWFVPIGPYLDARSAASRLTGKFITSDKMMGRNYPPQSSYWSTPPSFNGYSGVSLSRAVSTSLAVPMPTVKPLSKAASFQHCLNGLALLATAGAGLLSKGVR